MSGLFCVGRVKLKLHNATHRIVRLACCISSVLHTTIYHSILYHQSATFRKIKKTIIVVMLFYANTRCSLLRRACSRHRPTNFRWSLLMRVCLAGSGCGRGDDEEMYRPSSCVCVRWWYMCGATSVRLCMMKRRSCACCACLHETTRDTLYVAVARPTSENLWKCACGWIRVMMAAAVTYVTGGGGAGVGGAGCLGACAGGMLRFCNFTCDIH